MNIINFKILSILNPFHPYSKIYATTFKQSNIILQRDYIEDIMRTVTYTWLL